MVLKILIKQKGAFTCMYTFWCSVCRARPANVRPVDLTKKLLTNSAHREDPLLEYDTCLLKGQSRQMNTRLCLMML